MLSTDSPYLSQKELWAFGIQENKAEPSKSPLLRNSVVLQSQLPAICCLGAAGERGCAQSTSLAWGGDAPGAVRTMPCTSKSDSNAKLVKSSEHLLEKGFLSKGVLGECGKLLWDPAASHLGKVVFKVQHDKSHSPSGRRKFVSLPICLGLDWAKH